MPEIERIAQIPGVGRKLASKVIQVFGSEEAALEAIKNAQAATLASIPGVGSRTALSIIQEAYKIREGISPYEVLKTDDAKSLYHQIIEILQSYANSSFAKDKLSLYYPLPSSKVDEIRSRLDWFRQAAELVNKCRQEQLTELGDALSKARPLRSSSIPSMVTWRAILVDNEESLKRLREFGADKTSRLIRLQPGEQLEDYLTNYDFVLGALTQAGLGVSEHAGNFELLKTDFRAVDVSPETVISYYAVNHDVILSICEAAEGLKQLPLTTALQKFLDQIDTPKLQQLVEIIQKITNTGDIAEGKDLDYDRLREATRKFEMMVNETEVWANDRIRKEFSSSQVVIEGDQIISILEATTSEAMDPTQLRQYLPPKVFDILVRALQESEDRLSNLLQLKRGELEWIEGVFSESMALPIQAKQEKVRSLQNNLRRAMRAREHHLKVAIASELIKFETIVKNAVQTLLDFDLFQAVGRFAKDYKLSTPTLYTNRVGLGFQEGRNLFLMQQSLKGSIEVMPVSYTIGRTGWKPERTASERVTLLSGANSGGKSCLLQNIAQVAILSQMGMLVPAAKAEVSIFDELYYYTKARGMLTAGAFETSLRNLASIVMSNASKLACFDEWEASTEPGAAAKVIAAILELFYERENSCAIFVSHLADDILELSRVPVRVDGIVARGLDEKLNLLVDRSPRFGIVAKSTPELIVEKLFRSSDGQQRDVFEKILQLIRGSSVKSQET